MISEVVKLKNVDIKSKETFELSADEYIDDIYFDTGYNSRFLDVEVEPYVSGKRIVNLKNSDTRYSHNITLKIKSILKEE